MEECSLCPNLRVYLLYAAHCLWGHRHAADDVPLESCHKLYFCRACWERVNGSGLFYLNPVGTRH